MKKGDIFYIADPQTNTVLERTCIDNVNGVIHYNFRDSIIQKCPLENFLMYHHLDKQTAVNAVKQSHNRQASELRIKAAKLIARTERLESENPIVTDIICTEYSDIERIGRPKKK